MLIDQSDSFVFGCSKLDVMFGRAAPSWVRHPYSEIVKPGVRFVQATVRSIDPGGKRVPTDAGPFQGDVMVVGLGADLDIAAPCRAYAWVAVSRSSCGRTSVGGGRGDPDHPCRGVSRLVSMSLTAATASAGRPPQIHRRADGVRMIWVLTPAGFESLIEEVSVPAEALTVPPPSVVPPDNVGEILRRHGNELLEG